MDKRIVDLFAEGSKVAFNDGRVYNGAGEVSVYVGRVIDDTWSLAFGKGLKAGFIGGVAVCGIGVIAYNRYKHNRFKLVKNYGQEA